MRMIVYFLLLAFAAGLTLWRGTRGERTLALVLVAGNLITFAVVHLGSFSRYASVSEWYFLTDALLVGVLCAVAIWWPTWVSILIAAFQLNGLLGHFVKMLSPETFAWSYAMLLKTWGWLMVVALLLSRIRPTMRTPLSAAHWPYFSKAPATHIAARK